MPRVVDNRYPWMAAAFLRIRATNISFFGSSVVVRLLRIMSQIYGHPGIYRDCCRRNDTVSLYVRNIHRSCIEGNSLGTTISKRPCWQVEGTK
jgi:hypothetical protein